MRHLDSDYFQKVFEKLSEEASPFAQIEKLKEERCKECPLVKLLVGRKKGLKKADVHKRRYLEREAFDLGESSKSISPPENYPWFTKYQTPSRLLGVPAGLLPFILLTLLSSYLSFNHFTEGGNKEELLASFASDPKTPLIDYFNKPLFVPFYYGVNLADWVYRITNDKKEKSPPTRKI